MRRIGCLVALIVAVANGPNARADASLPSSDYIESVQQRAWVKRGAFMLEPEGAIAFNDPFLIRGGGGLRAVYWVRSLVGVSVEASGWGQTPTVDAIVAQSQLHAEMRPTASSWAALAGAEVTPVDGKIAFLSSIVPFEMFLRLAVGSAASTESVTSSPTVAFSAGLGARWFLNNRFALDTSFSWRSDSITRALNGTTIDSRDTLVSFDVGVPFRFGGGP